MNTSKLSNRRYVHTLDIEETPNERTSLLGHRRTHEGEGQNNEDEHNKGKCCKILSVLFLFAFIVCIILGQRFFIDIKSDTPKDTEYGEGLCVFLIIVIAIGNLCQLLLICLTFYNSRCEGEAKVCVEKIFFFVLGFFSTGSFLIDALNSKNSCPLPYNILCCIFSAMQTFYHCSNDSIFLMSGKRNNLLLTLLIVVNLCIWFDTETIEIYRIFYTSPNSSVYFNRTIPDDGLLNDITDMLHPYTTPLKIEYFLMAIELLSSTTKRRSDQRYITAYQTNDNTSNCLSDATRNFLRKIKAKRQLDYTIKGCYVVLVILFVSLAISVVIVRDYPNAESMTVYYNRYKLFELVFDILQSIFLIIVLLVTYHLLKSCPKDIHIIVFAICAFAHIVYNSFDAFGAFYLRMYAGLVNCIFTILGTILQTFFLLSIHLNYHDEIDRQYLSMMFFLLAINNMGFWMVDSLATARYPSYVYSLKLFFNDTWWKILNKIVFPLIVFYRFKAAMYFFEMRGKSENINA